MRLRVVAGCVLAVLAVALSGPPTWLPWNRPLHALATAWWMVPAAASLLLLGSALLLPVPTRPEDDGTGRHRADSVALGLGLLLVLEPLLHLAVLALLAVRRTPGAEDVLLPGAPASQPVALAIQVGVLCILAPIAEELFFRGRLLPWLAARLGPGSALSASALAFAVAHGSPIACLLAVPVGLVLGWLRLSRRDLGACIIVHQVHNGLILLAGPALFTLPLAAAVLAGGGVVLLALAAAHAGGRWRALPAGLALGAGLALALPPMLTLKDRLWAEGTARLLAKPEATTAQLVARLDRERRRGRLTAARTAQLRDRLGGSEAALAVRMLLDGGTAAASSEDEAADLLRAALAVPAPPVPLAEAAAAIGTAWPGALAGVAIEAPAMVATWLGPARAPAAIAAARGPDRKRLLAALERVWPGRLASVLFALPPGEVTPIDRRHLRANYPDADALVEALDPVRRAAWAR